MPEMNDESGLYRFLPLTLVGIFVAAMLALVVDLVIYVSYFPGSIQSEHSQWAEFGDFLGGTLGPFFALLGLLALLLTVILQSRELRLSTRELANSVKALKEQGEAVKLQNFERTVFEMVRLHHDIVKAMDIRDANNNVTRAGRDCFRVFYERFKKRHGEANARFNSRGQSVIIVEAYGPFYREHQHDIGHYFRNFHRILKLVDESHVENKSNYTGILRAQLSSYELALLFYNVLHPIGRKLKPLVERYEILENMDLALLCNPPDEVPLFERRAFGDQDLSTILRPA